MEMHGLRKNSRMPVYMMFPRFLDGLRELTDTEKYLYIHLLDRARLSMKNEGWEDENGEVFLNYTIESIAKDLCRGLTTVKSSLRNLEKHGLIRRKRQGPGKPSRIYVMIPESESRPTAKAKTGTYQKPGEIPYGNRNYDYDEGESL